MDLQCSKWQIDLKIEDFVFLTPLLTFILAHIAPINGYKTLIRLTEYMFLIDLFTQPPRDSMYGVTAQQIQIWSQNGRFGSSDPHFDLYFSPYCTRKRV